MTGKELWYAALVNIKVQVPTASFDTWFRNTRFKDFMNNQLYIEVENEFQRDWLDSHYGEMVNKVLYELANETIIISYIITWESLKKEPEKFASRPSSLKIDNNDELIQMIKELEQRVDVLENEVYEIKTKEA